MSTAARRRSSILTRPRFAATLVLSAWLGCAPAALLAVPPPPKPPGTPDYLAELTAAYNRHASGEYLSHFSEDVAVYQDSAFVGRGREVLRKMIAKQFAAGWHVRPVAAFEGNQILVLEQVNNVPPARPGSIADCCFWSRAVRYHLATSSLIDRVDIMEADSAWNRSEIPPPDGQ